MRKWLVLAPADHQGRRIMHLADANQLERLTEFESGEEGRPREEELREAIGAVLGEGEAELRVVPLDDAFDIQVKVKPNVELVATGTFA